VARLLPAATTSDGVHRNTNTYTIQSGTTITPGSFTGAFAAALNTNTPDWIAFLDADDAWFPEKLHRQTKLLETLNTPAMWMTTTDR